MMMGAERIPQGSPGREKLMAAFAAFAAADVEDQLYDAWVAATGPSSVPNHAQTRRTDFLLIFLMLRIEQLVC
jgi:hypothetical protein